MGGHQINKASNNLIIESPETPRKGRTFTHRRFGIVADALLA